jgi:hypothetical protein
MLTTTLKGEQPMTTMTLFGKPTPVSPLLAGLTDSLTDTIAGGSGGGSRRISIKGGVFREIVGGKEVRVNEERGMNVVIVNAAPVSRMFYAGTYVEGEVTKPACWSSDGDRPDAQVPADTRQASRCMDCKQNIKGSGQGESRACRYQQRVAVLLEGEMDKREVYQVTLPATSVFGDGDKTKMPLQAYGRHLKAHGTQAVSIITEMRFDTASPTPKLVFKPVRMLTEEELAIAVEMRDHADAVKAITLTVAQMDGVTAPAKKPEALFAPAAAAKPTAPEPEVEEPKKVAKKTATVAEPTEGPSIDEIVGNWDD